MNGASRAGDGPVPVGRLGSLLHVRPGLALFLLLLPPALWFGTIYLGSLLTLVLQSFYSIDDYTGAIVREPTLATLRTR